MSTATVDAADTLRGSGAPRRAPAKKRGRPTTVAFLTLMALAWVFPILWALFNSFRTYSYTQQNGYLSLGGWTFDNYRRAWTNAEMGKHFVNSVIITVPTVILTIFLASLAAFVLARFSYRFNLVMLAVFLSANLLPPQALLVPIFRLYKAVPMPVLLSDSGTLLNTFIGLIAINVAFQLGFCTFVLSNYMKTLPKEIYESAEIDGATIWRQYWQLTMPLVRPALAALATLQVTWVYNEFFWATVLLQDSDKFPITSSLNNLRGQFFVDYNLLAAGSVLVALPVLIVFFLLQKQFVAGLTLGSTKG